MNTGENEQGLRTIIDFVRKGSMIVLGMHFYIVCFGAFVEWGLQAEIVTRVIRNIARSALFSNPYYAKSFSLGLLVLTLVGSKGKKEEKILPATIVIYIITGLLFYYGSVFVFYVTAATKIIATGYMMLTSVGYLFILTGGGRLSRLIKIKLDKDIFNEENETFPQEEQCLENEYSINLPGQYKFKGKVRHNWVNYISPHRGVLCVGSPGSGKSFYFIREAILQALHKEVKNFDMSTMFIYDFKFPDLTNIAYNTWLKHKNKYHNPPRFFYINFDDLNTSHRCNPLDPSTMEDITDAAESARSILLGLNKDWVRKSGDFFVESPINFVTAIIWFLRKYKGGIYCTLPHVIELMQVDYNDLFPILGTEAEIEVLINPFITAYMNRAMEQLEGQIASAKIGMARLSSPQLYYVLSGDDFTLDINNPDDPKIVCCGNNPLKIQTYGAVLSLYINRLLKLVNRKKQRKSTILFDEYPTIYSPLDTVLATGRSNLISTIIAVQSIEQVRKDYSKEQAEVLINICGNIICGQTFGDSAKILSERIGKIVQERESVSINRTDANFSRNTQLDFAIPASKIAQLSSGEFVGMVADTPSQPIKLKVFHCRIINDPEAIKAEEAAYKPLPKVRNVASLEVQSNYIRIKNEIVDLQETEIKRIKDDPELAHLLFVKKKPKTTEGK